MRWQYFDELEADFQQYYSLDIMQLMPARAARLLFQLPRGCRVFTKLQPANEWGWAEVLANRTAYLLELMLWQNSYNPKKKTAHLASKPKPFIPKFMAKETAPSPLNNETKPQTVTDVRNILAQPRG